MPTYDYSCTKCGKAFELFPSITDKPKRTVPPELKNCRCKAPVTRLLGAGGGVLFRGSGFYETDYKRSSYRADRKKDTGSNETGPKKKDETSGAGSSSSDEPKKSGTKKDGSKKSD